MTTIKPIIIKIFISVSIPLFIFAAFTAYASSDPFEKAKSLMKTKKYQEVIELLSKHKNKSSENYYLNALALFHTGKLEQAYLSNSKAAESGHNGAIFNNVCIASTLENPSVAFYWLSLLWENIRQDPKLLKKYFALLIKDPDLTNLRQSKYFQDVVAMIDGTFKQRVLDSEAAVYKNEKFKVEESPYWQGQPWSGIVIHVPKKLKLSNKKPLIPVKSFMKVSSPMGMFEGKRDIVAIDVKTKKKYQAFYAPMLEEEIEARPPFYVPSLKEPQSDGQSSGGRMDFEMDLGIPDTPGVYDIYIDSVQFRSNTVRISLEK